MCGQINWETLDDVLRVFLHRLWDLNPRPFGLEPESSALDRSAKSTLT